MHFLFALRYFKAKKSATAINIISWVTVTVIAFATCCQVLVLSVFNGFEGLVKSLYSSFYSDLRIIPAKGKTFTLTVQQINNIREQPFTAGFAMTAEEKALLQDRFFANGCHIKRCGQQLQEYQRRGGSYYCRQVYHRRCR